MRDAERRGVVCGHVVEERPDRRQTRIAGLDRVLPLLLKLVQEGENDVAVEMLDGQLTRLTPGLIGGEQDQHAQGVAIAGDRRALALRCLASRLRKKDSSSGGREECALMRHLRR